jgi:hypothetical protein
MARGRGKTADRSRLDRRSTSALFRWPSRRADVPQGQLNRQPAMKKAGIAGLFSIL